MLKNIEEFQNEVKNQQKELRISEMNTLISQINPHFLYNTLDTIYMLARINGEEKTMKMIQALSKYLRLSLSKGREIVTVEDELENVKSYMEIQQIRNENLFRYEIECAEELKTRWILKLILQPIVENAVKYGFCDIFEGGLIRISVTEQAGQLTFSVYNNGTPMEEQMAEKLNGLSEIPVSKMKDSFEDKKHGYGVINIITRLRLKYGEDVRFFYESDTNGTVCVIQIRMTGKKTVNSRRIMAAVMVIAMLTALTGCAGKENTQTRKKNKVVEIPMILTVDSSTGNKNEEEVVERFNRAYKGSII